MCRLRRPVRCWLWPEGTGEASGLAGGGLSLATQRKVTRPSPKGGRNPVEGPALASCTAPAVPRIYEPPHPQPFSREGRREQRRFREQAPLPRGEKGAKAISGTGPSPARGEGSKDDLGNKSLSHEGRREQRRSREQAPLPQGEKEAKTISGVIPSPVGRGSG